VCNRLLRHCIGYHVLQWNMVLILWLQCCQLRKSSPNRLYCGRLHLYIWCHCFCNMRNGLSGPSECHYMRCWRLDRFKYMPVTRMSRTYSNRLHFSLRTLDDWYSTVRNVCIRMEWDPFFNCLSIGCSLVRVFWLCVRN